jgi:hypothetical protein
MKDLRNLRVLFHIGSILTGNSIASLLHFLPTLLLIIVPSAFFSCVCPVVSPELFRVLVPPELVTLVAISEMVQNDLCFHKKT